MMAAGKVLRGVIFAAQVLGGIMMLTEFMSMAQNAIAKRGFVLGKEIEEAEKVRDESVAMRAEYEPFSDDVHAMGLALLISFADPPTLKPVLDSLSDLGSEISASRTDLRKQSVRVKGALKEVSAKRDAAEAVLSDPVASGTLAAATFGGADLAKIFTAYVDLDMLRNILPQRRRGDRPHTRSPR